MVQPGELRHGLDVRGPSSICSERGDLAVPACPRLEQSKSPDLPSTERRRCRCDGQRVRACLAGQRQVRLPWACPGHAGEGCRGALQPGAQVEELPRRLGPQYRHAMLPDLGCTKLDVPGGKRDRSRSRLQALDRIWRDLAQEVQGDVEIVGGHEACRRAKVTGIPPAHHRFAFAPVRNEGEEDACHAASMKGASIRIRSGVGRLVVGAAIVRRAP